MEVDLARFYQIDYRDRYRTTPAGRPRLPIRRLLLLVDHLPPESAFASERAERYPLSREQAALYDLYAAFSGQQHPYPTAKAKAEQAERKKELIARKSQERRAQNARYLEATRVTTE